METTPLSSIMPSLFTSLQYPKFKLLLLVLLAVNAGVYAITDTWIQAVDALVWLVLLVLYEMETNSNTLPFSARTLQTIRHLSIATVALVFVGYLQTDAWLDVINSLLWFVLIALLEAEMRWPETVLRQSQIFWLSTLATFIGLIAMAAVWLWQGAWLDAYDAALWIAAFGLIEVDIFRFLQRRKP